MAGRCNRTIRVEANDGRGGIALAVHRVILVLDGVLVLQHSPGPFMLF
jgi:hypothetical protein